MKRVNHTNPPAKPKRTRAVTRRPRPRAGERISYRESFIVPISSHGPAFPLGRIIGTIIYGMIYTIMALIVVMNTIPKFVNNPHYDFMISGMVMSAFIFIFIFNPVAKEIRRHHEMKNYGAMDVNRLTMIIGSHGNSRMGHHHVVPNGAYVRRPLSSPPAPPRPRIPMKDTYE